MAHPENRENTIEEHNRKHKNNKIHNHNSHNRTQKQNKKEHNRQIPDGIFKNLSIVS
jgi:hypothetical protein